jgi:hypothetical protein
VSDEVELVEGLMMLFEKGFGDFHMNETVLRMHGNDVAIASDIL